MINAYKSQKILDTPLTQKRDVQLYFKNPEKT